MSKTFNRNILRPTVLALAAAACASAIAQDNAQTLSEVVVSATGFEQELKQAPASISVVTRADLEKKNYRDLAEALQGVEGIDVLGGTGKAGGFDITIRGMPSDYTLILIDGRRQNVAADATPNGFGSALNSLIPPVSAIERIEVIRGPMSTLYGSDAMGGVINIITRKVATKWGGEANLSVGLPQDSDWGNQGKFNFYLNGPLKQDVAGLAVRGSLFDRDAANWVVAPGARASGRNPAPAQSRQHSIGAKLTVAPNRQNDFWLDIEQGRTWYNNSDCRLGNLDRKASGTGGSANCFTTGPTVHAPGYKDKLFFNRDQIAVGHNARLGIGLLETSLMQATTETEGRTIAGTPIGSTFTRNGKVFTVGADRELKATNLVLDSKLVAPLNDTHLLTVGGQITQTKLKDGLLDSDYKRSTWSIFAEDEWKIAEQLTTTLGARYDNHDVFGGHLSPRAYAVWNTTPNWTLKGGVSKGFKAPRVNQLIDGVSGVGAQGADISIGNPNLRPETSTSTELSAAFDSLMGMTGSATLFHNKIKDKISNVGSCANAPISSCVANTTASYNINVDEATTWGLELSSRLQLNPQWSVKAGYTWTHSEVIEKGKKNGQLANTAKHLANLQLDWKPQQKLGLWARAEFRGKSPRFSGTRDTMTAANRNVYDAVGDLKGYSLFHVGGTYQVSKNFNLNANIYNLLNKDFRNFQQVNVAGVPTWINSYYQGGQNVAGSTLPGRTLWVTANVQF